MIIDNNNNDDDDDKPAFQSKADHPQTGYTDVFCLCDLDLDRMTLTYELDLDILKTQRQTKNELSTSDTDKNATENITVQHSRVVVTSNSAIAERPNCRVG